MTTENLARMILVWKKMFVSNEINWDYDYQREDPVIPVPPNPISRQWRKRALPAGKGKSGRRNGSPLCWPSLPPVGCLYTPWIVYRCSVDRRVACASHSLSCWVTSTPPLTLFSTHIPIRNFPLLSAECWSSDHSLPVPRTIRQFLRWGQLRYTHGQFDESLNILCVNRSVYKVYKVSRTVS